VLSDTSNLKSIRVLQCAIAPNDYLYVCMHSFQYFSMQYCNNDYNMTMVFSESTVFIHNTSYTYSIDQFCLSDA